MKTIRKFWFVLIAPLLIFSSCDLLSGLSQDITIEAPDQEFTVTNPSAVAGLSKVAAVAEPVEIFNKEISMDIAAKVKETAGIELNIIKALKLKTAKIGTSTSTFDLDEIKNLKMYAGDEATEANLVAEVTSVDKTLNVATLTVKNTDIYAKMGTSEKLRIILVNDAKFNSPSVDLVLKTSYIVTVGF